MIGRRRSALGRTAQTSIASRIPLTVLLALGALCSTGCLQGIVMDETLAGARKASASAETLHDYELARELTYSGIGQLEGFHWLRPGNTDGLLMLNKAWCGFGQAFVLDDYELALERDDDDAAEYHQLRARAAFARAKFYGLALLELRASGFERAAVKQNTLRAWLRDKIDEAEYAEELLWLGIAWLSHISVDTENSETISRLWVGVELLEHVVRLDDRVEYGLAHIVLGSFNARSLMGEMDEAKGHFERAFEINRGRYLPTQLALATRYHCTTRDKKRYQSVLRSIVSAADPLPEARLANTIAKRRARRYLAKRMWQEDCGFEL